MLIRSKTIAALGAGAAGLLLFLAGAHGGACAPMAPKLLTNIATEIAAREAPANSRDLEGEEIMIGARPVALVRGEAQWDRAALLIEESLAKVLEAVRNSPDVVASGNPIVLFIGADDTGFRYEAMAPIVRAPEGKTRLADGVELGLSPAGKALRFHHRGDYGDIDGTYEAINERLEQKGLEAPDRFVEEYLTDPMRLEDAATQVDIYVLLK